MFLVSMLPLLMYGQQRAVVQGDYPDPTVIYSNGKYYSIGTSSEWAPHFPIYVSSDLHRWQQSGFLFEQAPDWAASSFWAAEYFYNDGLYYVYYSAKRKSDGVSCIGVATSKYPDHGFIDRGIVVDYGTESIDAFVVREGTDLYMTWKAYGLDERPIELLGSKLSADGMRLEGQPFSLLQDTARVGIEGQSFIKKDGYYYMFYSAGACCGVNCDYRVQAVRARSIRGPYEHVGLPVILGENQAWKCMGHGTFVEAADGQHYYLLHGYSKKGGTLTGREGLLAKLQWNAQGEPSLLLVQDSPAGAPPAKHIDFRQRQQADSLFWQWDFRYATPQWQFGKTGLRLGGSYAADNPSGIALAWRPSSLRYSIEATLNDLESSPQAAKGLVIYGDKDRAIGLDIQDAKLLFWRVQDGKKVILGSTELGAATTRHELSLKLSLTDGLLCRAYWKAGGQWNELPAQDQRQAVIADLAPWDRSPRPGLHVQGSGHDTATFSSMTLTEE